MPTTETPVRLTEQELVEQWRAEALERAGYPPQAAVELAARGDVDLHRARRADQERLHARARAADPALDSNP